MIRCPSIAFFGSSIGSGEVLLVLVVALMIFGPHKLPGIARTLGRWISDLRRSAREFTDELTRAATETKDPSPSNKFPHRTADKFPRPPEK